MDYREYARRLMAGVTFDPEIENIAFVFGRDLGMEIPTVALFKYKIKWVNENIAVYDKRSPITVIPGSVFINYGHKHACIDELNRCNASDCSHPYGDIRILDRPIELSSVSKLAKLTNGVTAPNPNKPGSGGNAGTTYSYVRKLGFEKIYDMTELGINLNDIQQQANSIKNNSLCLEYDTEAERKIIMDYLDLVRKKAAKENE